MNANPTSEPQIAHTPYRAAVLRHVLELRYRALLGSPRTREAVERHQRFLARSEAYRDAVARGDGRAGGPSPDHTAICGLEWWVPPDTRSDNGFADRVLRKKWLPLTDILLARELAIGTAMIDVGANIGTTSIPRVILGDFQYVYAAEPEPANYDCLVQNILANGLAGFVLPDRVGIGDADGDGTLRVSVKMAQHVLSREPLGEGDAKRHVAVRCRTLDTWVREHGIDLHDVSFVKCDTQGWEGYVLRGAPEILRHKHIAWQLEFWPKGLRKAGFDRDELYDLIQANFTHFVELSDGLQDRLHARSIRHLKKALSDVGTETRGGTDILVYNARG
jgi:FkbM family methyltransferase